MTTKPYSVSLWGSHPKHDNDDCWVGDDFATLEEAHAAADNWVAHFEGDDLPGYYSTSTAYVEIDGPDTHELRHVGNPKRTDDTAWRHEIAMEAGMLHGVDAFNEIMGY